MDGDVNFVEYNEITHISVIFTVILPVFKSLIILRSIGWKLIWQKFNAVPK